jgi:hypothetical protein
MPNHISDVERITDSMRRGWPDGAHDAHREIPKLLQRIQELENALVPFARVAVTEKSSNPQYQLVQLVHVYLKDCEHAEQMLNPQYSVQQPINDFFSLPAEG